MSASAPNMQQLPKDGPYRAMVRAAPGYKLVKADFSQMELRIAAALSKDPAMSKAFRDGEDLHRLTAAAVLAKTPEAVTAEDRQLAKALNFGLIFGMGADRLQSHARANYGVVLTLGKAKALRESFFRLYPVLRAWQQSWGTSEGWAETRAGRKRFGNLTYTERLNTPVQGTGADILKLAMGRLHAALTQFAGARLVLAVHDELVVECREEDAAAVADQLKAVMEGAMAELVPEVPAVVDVRIGQSWGE